MGDFKDRGKERDEFCSDLDSNRLSGRSRGLRQNARPEGRSRTTRPSRRDRRSRPAWPSGASRPSRTSRPSRSAWSYGRGRCRGGSRFSRSARAIVSRSLGPHELHRDGLHRAMQSRRRGAYRLLRCWEKSSDLSNRALRELSGPYASEQSTCHCVHCPMKINGRLVSAYVGALDSRPSPRASPKG
jgi:hypothetical protein